MAKVHRGNHYPHPTHFKRDLPGQTVWAWFARCACERCVTYRVAAFSAAAATGEWAHMHPSDSGFAKGKRGRKNALG